MQKNGSGEESWDDTDLHLNELSPVEVLNAVVNPGAKMSMKICSGHIRNSW